MPRLDVHLDVSLTADRAWDALTDWDSQGEWMLATTVRTQGVQRRAPGDRLEAFTGLGPVGFTDTMVVTDWDEGRSVSVDHTGRVVRGTGTFGVLPLPDGTCRIEWSEDLDVPGGRAGQLVWAFTRPVTRAAVLFSLRRLARQLA